MRRATHGLVVLVLTAAFAPAASADVDAFKERYAPRRGPVLAGDELVWARDGGPRRLSIRAGAGGSSRELLAVTGAQPGSRLDAWLSASATSLAVEIVDQVRDPDPFYTTPLQWSRSLLAGPVDGTLAPLAAPCTDVADAENPFGIAVTGTQVAFNGPDCGGRSVWDLYDGRRIALPASADELRLDGDWVAWREPGGIYGRHEVVVQNLRTAQRYRARAPNADVPPVDFDVDRDGRVVICPVGSAGCQRLSLATPSDPATRAVDLGRAARIVRVRIEGGTIAALAHRPNASDPLLAGYVLAGDPSQGPLRRRGAGLDANVVAPFDFDGARVAVQVRRCGRVELLRADRLSELPEVAPRVRCSLRLLEPPYVKERWLIVSFSCAGYVRTCDAEPARAATAGRSPRLVARARPAIGHTRAHLALTALGRRLVRRGKLRRVRIAAYVTDDFGFWPGRRHTVKTRVSPAGSPAPAESGSRGRPRS